MYRDIREEQPSSHPNVCRQWGHLSGTAVRTIPLCKGNRDAKVGTAAIRTTLASLNAGTLICLGEKFPGRPLTRGHVCWKWKDQSPGPSDSWVLVPWGPWLYPPSFQVSVLLSMLFSDLGDPPAIEVSGAEQGTARALSLLSAPGQPAEVAELPFPVRRGFLLLPPNDFCIHLFAAF